MCLAIPGRVLEIFEDRGLRMGRADFGGTVRKVCLEHLPEAGIGDYEVTSWNGMCAPQGTPREILDVLNRSLRDILAIPEVKKQYADVGIEAKASSPEELGTRLRQDIEKWSKVIERAGIAKQ